DRGGWIVAPHANHLCTWNHDVAHLDVTDLQHAFEHGQRFRIHHAPLPGLAQQREQLLTVLWLPRETLGDALQPAAGGIPVLGHHELRYGFGNPSWRSTEISRRSIRVASAGCMWS